MLPEQALQDVDRRHCFFGLNLPDVKRIRCGIDLLNAHAPSIAQLHVHLFAEVPEAVEPGVFFRLGLSHDPDGGCGIHQNARRTRCWPDSPMS